MYKKYFLIAVAFALGIGGAFATKTSASNPGSANITYYENVPPCTARDCSQSGTISCNNFYLNNDCTGSQVFTSLKYNP